MENQVIDGKIFYNMIAISAAELYNNRKQVDALNVFPVPDGDTGTNMSLTLKGAFDELFKQKDLELPKLVRLFARGLLMGARGNSGVILSQIFRGFESYASKHQELDTLQFSKALKSASKAAYKAVLKPVEGTILTVIREMSEGAEKIAKKEKDFIPYLEQLIELGEKSLRNTPNLLAPLKEAGVVDSGGMGLMYIFKGFLLAIKGEEKTYDDFLSNDSSNITAAHHLQLSPDEITFSYCTEFIIEGENLDDKKLKDYIMSMGDSVVYVQDDKLLKVHVHTNEPGEVLTKALKYGHIVKTKIENMVLQYSDIVDAKESTLNKNEEPFTDAKQDSNWGSKKEIGYIAVASGKGFNDIFSSLGVDLVIEGGQTMNPSTNDFVEAAKKINAEKIIILPNNSNIILAASQACEVSDQNLNLVATKTIPQGIQVMMNQNQNFNLEENLEAANEAISEVKTIQITHAVRDSVVKDLKIKKGDFIALVDGEIKCSKPSIKEALFDSITMVADDETEFIAVYKGAELKENIDVEIIEKIENKYPDIDYEIIEGNQPVYYYIVSVE